MCHVYRNGKRCRYNNSLYNGYARADRFMSANAQAVITVDSLIKLVFDLGLRSFFKFAISPVRSYYNTTRTHKKPNTD